MQAIAWKTYHSKTKLVYLIQVEDIKGVRQEKKILKQLEESEWKLFADGYNPKKNTRTLILESEFEEESQWINWARSFPYKLVEMGKSGKMKPYKLGLDYIESPRRKRKNNV